MKPIWKIVGEYANAVGRYGPDSPETKQVRETYKENLEFLEYADALDRIKRHLRGSGIDKSVESN